MGKYNYMHVVLQNMEPRTIFAKPVLSGENGSDSANRND